MSYESSLAIRCYIRQAFAISLVYYTLFRAVYWSLLNKPPSPQYLSNLILHSLVLNSGPPLRVAFLFRETSTSSEEMNGYDSVMLEVTNPVL